MQDTRLDMTDEAAEYIRGQQRWLNEVRPVKGTHLIVLCAPAHQNGWECSWVSPWMDALVGRTVQFHKAQGADGIMVPLRRHVVRAVLYPRTMQIITRGYMWEQYIPVEPNLEQEDSYIEAQEQWMERVQPHKGDSFIVAGRPTHSNGWTCRWTKQMDNLAGAEVRFDTENGSMGIGIVGRQGRYVVPFFVLMPCSRN